ncbi:MAG: hypothetical protein Q4D48_00130 [Coriobacteriales bacterium]|nr:hypothetical protein [Coriobacteriales bacterium]
MPSITPGNHLYFYQLFSTELGVGKQTTLQRVEEVLAEADVLLDDVDCETVEELLNELADFVKLTVFKKGRVFATVMQREDLDLLLEKAAQPVVDKSAAAAGKSWKRNRRSRDIRPTKPRHKKKPQVAVANVPEEKPVDETGAVVEEVVTVLEDTTVTSEPEPKPELEPTAELVTKMETEPVPVVETEPKPVIEAEAEPESEPDSELEPESESESEPEPEPESEQEPEFESEPESEPESELEPESEPEERNPQRIRTSEKLRRITLPIVFSEDVYCPSDQLWELYQLLPDNIGIMDALDEGWKFAQQAGTVEGTRSVLTFPLSRTNLPGYPIEVTVKRAARIPSGKAWQLVKVIRDEEE